VEQDRGQHVCCSCLSNSNLKGMPVWQPLGNRWGAAVNLAQGNGKSRPRQRNSLKTKVRRRLQGGSPEMTLEDVPFSKIFAMPEETPTGAAMGPIRFPRPH